jgi:hypothetical protein
MFKSDKPVPYPADPDQVTWDYELGTEFTGSELKGSGGLLRAPRQLVHPRRRHR